MMRENIIIHLVCVREGGGEGGHPNDVLFAQSSLSHTHTHYIRTLFLMLSLSLLLIMKTIKLIYHRLKNNNYIRQGMDTLRYRIFTIPTSDCHIHAPVFRTNNSRLAIIICHYLSRRPVL